MVALCGAASAWCAPPARSSSADRALVDVEAAVPGIRVQLPYATPHNVFRRRFYTTPRAFLRAGTARKLRTAQALLQKQGLGLKVWDAYRPRSVQRAMWLQVRNPRYVGPPTEGSRHSRGAAVDVTLVDRNGRELPMPTGFDDFSPRAHAGARTTRAAARNREILRRAMVRAGFQPQWSEWWHFNDPHAARYAISDVAPSTLARTVPPAWKPRGGSGAAGVTRAG